MAQGRVLGALVFLALFASSRGFAAEGHGENCGMPDFGNTAASPIAFEVEPQVSVPYESTHSTLPGGERQLVVFFKGFKIDKLYPSMRGPTAKQTFDLASKEKTPRIWILSYRAEILDSGSKKMSQKFMCHSNLDLQKDGKTYYKLSLSQGQEEITFPEGFAFPIETGEGSLIRLTGEVLNNNEQDIGQQVDFKITVRYVDEATALAKGLKPLAAGGVQVRCVTKGPVKDGEVGCVPAIPGQAAEFEPGRWNTVHWIVPPGRQTLVMDATRMIQLSRDTTVHTIWMHVHPYAESMTLEDVTEGRTVWVGRVKNSPDPGRAEILHKDSFSSVEGIPLRKDHRYRLTTVYDNRTDHDIDAMASMALFRAQ